MLPPFESLNECHGPWRPFAMMMLAVVVVEVVDHVGDGDRAAGAGRARAAAVVPAVAGRAGGARRRTRRAGGVAVVTEVPAAAGRAGGPRDARRAGLSAAVARSRPAAPVAPVTGRARRSVAAGVVARLGQPTARSQQQANR